MVRVPLVYITSASTPLANCSYDTVVIIIGVTKGGLGSKLFVSLHLLQVSS